MARKMILLLLALMLCMGALVACGKNNDTNVGDQNETTNQNDGTAADQGNDSTDPDSTAQDAQGEAGTYTVGKLTAINEDGSYQLTLYRAEQEADFSDYLMADLSGYAATKASETLTLGENTKIVLAKDGELTDATAADLVQGDLLVVEKNGDTVVQVVAYGEIDS